MKKAAKICLQFSGTPLTDRQKRRITEIFIEDLAKPLEAIGAKFTSAKLAGQNILAAIPKQKAREFLDALLSNTSKKATTAKEREEFIRSRVEDFYFVAERFAETESERAHLRELRQAYEKAIYGPALRRTFRGKRALNFLKSWQRGLRLKPGENNSNDDQQTLIDLSPIIAALNLGDAQFFEQLAAGIRFLERRDRVREVRKRIAEAAILQGPKASMTADEARQKFWPENTGDLKNFERILDECGFAWKRGKGGRPKNGVLKSRFQR